MKGFGKVLKTICKAEVKPLCLIIVAIFGFCAVKHDFRDFPGLVLLMFLPWMLICVVLALIAWKSVRKQKPLHDIYENEGFSENYLAKFQEIYPQFGNSEKIRLCDIYIGLERYADAKQMLENIVENELAAPEIPVFQNVRMTYFLFTHQKHNAIQTFTSHKTVLDYYAKEHMSAAGSYLSNAVLILAMQGEQADSDRYFDLFQLWRDCMGKKLISDYPVKITRMAQLYLLGYTTNAELLEQELLKNITEEQNFEHEWQRESTLRSLKQHAALGKNSEA